MPILIPVLVLFVIAIICALILTVSSIFFAVKEDERALAVRDCLPGANCGACGFSGCDGYAKALSEGKTDNPSLCIPGGDGVAKDYVDAELAKKQNIIDDIEDIRSNAALAATALQEGDLVGYVTEDALNKKGYLTEHQDISGKQDVIENLNDIISGASAGATALQPGDLEGYLTEDTLSNSNVITGINSQIADINALLGEAVNITNTILA